MNGRTGKGERGTGNGERGTGNGERGTGNVERGTGDVGGSHDLKGEQKGDQSSPTEYKWRTMEN